MPTTEFPFRQAAQSVRFKQTAQRILQSPRKYGCSKDGSSYTPSPDLSQRTKHFGSEAVGKTHRLFFYFYRISRAGKNGRATSAKRQRLTVSIALKTPRCW